MLTSGKEKQGGFVGGGVGVKQAPLLVDPGGEFCPDGQLVQVVLRWLVSDWYVSAPHAVQTGFAVHPT